MAGAGGSRTGAPAAVARRRGAHLPSVLLRLVDDFLVITPSRATAEAMALRMLQGASYVCLTVDVVCSTVDINEGLRQAKVRA